jgi:hypothetical protein
MINTKVRLAAECLKTYTGLILRLRLIELARLNRNRPIIEK